VSELSQAPVAGALVDLTVFSSLTQGLKLAPALANVPSFGSGTISGFFLNRFWVFRRSRGAPAVQLAKFVAVNAASLVISTVAVAFMAMIMPAILAKLLSLPITFCWNFGLSRAWVFKSRRVHDASGPAD
jgi:putative flippase GtrA